MLFILEANNRLNASFESLCTDGQQDESDMGFFNKSLVILTAVSYRSKTSII